MVYGPALMGIMLLGTLWILLSVGDRVDTTEDMLDNGTNDNERN